MNKYKDILVVEPTSLNGQVYTPPSKSEEQRILILQAIEVLQNQKSKITYIPYNSCDIQAITNSLASILNGNNEINCIESGFTLRSLLPLCLSLYPKAKIYGKKSLFTRPLDPYFNLMKDADISWSFKKDSKGYFMETIGLLNLADFSTPLFIDSSISSQFITGLIFTLTLHSIKKSIITKGVPSSLEYINLTANLLNQCGINLKTMRVHFGKNKVYYLFRPIFKNTSKEVSNSTSLKAGGDWSGGAYWLVAKALNMDIEIKNLQKNSPQGDSIAEEYINKIMFSEEENIELNMINYPDLAIPLSLLAYLSPKNITFKNCETLAFKESNRIEAIDNLYSTLGQGIKVKNEGNSTNIIFKGKKKLFGGIVDSFNDHRIAMLAILIGTLSEGTTVITNSSAINKSYPTFLDDFLKLGGKARFYDKVSSIGGCYPLHIWGGSHEKEIGFIFENIMNCFNFKTKEDFINSQVYNLCLKNLERRKPIKNISTTRKEKDLPEIISLNPLCITFKNNNVRKSDYNLNIPRPGHADITARYKYGNNINISGGGPFSGRMTIAITMAGSLAEYLLEERGIQCLYRISKLGDILDVPMDLLNPPTKIASHIPETLSKEISEKMIEKIIAVKGEGDSIGGTVEFWVNNFPKGYGDFLFGGIESEISKYIFSIPGVKAVDFGIGFDYSHKKGSKCHDQYSINNSELTFESNNCGGVLGGISTGYPIIGRAVFKATPSIEKTLKSVDLSTLKNVSLSTKGRHDPAIVVRGAPIIKSALALSLLEILSKEEN